MRALLVVVLAVCSSCSMLFMEPLEDDWHYTREPRCTETAGFAAWDLSLALLNGAGAAWSTYAFRETEGDPDYEGVRPALGVSALAGFIGLAVYGTSAVVGFRRSDRCAAARRKRDRYLDWREETIRRQKTPPAAPTYRVEPAPPEELEPDAGAPLPPADAGPPPQG